MPLTGWLPVTVPGQVAGWEALGARFGRFGLDRLLAPAIRLARDGFAVGPITAAAWARSVPVFGGFDERRRVFGDPPAAGGTFRNPDLARRARPGDGRVAHRGRPARPRGPLGDPARGRVPRRADLRDGRADPGGGRARGPRAARRARGRDGPRSDRGREARVCRRLCDGGRRVDDRSAGRRARVPAAVRARSAAGRTVTGDVPVRRDRARVHRRRGGAGVQPHPVELPRVRERDRRSRDRDRLAEPRRRVRPRPRAPERRGRRKAAVSHDPPGSDPRRPAVDRVRVHGRPDAAPGGTCSSSRRWWRGPARRPRSMRPAGGGSTRVPSPWRSASTPGWPRSSPLGVTISLPGSQRCSSVEPRSSRRMGGRQRPTEGRRGRPAGTNVNQTGTASVAVRSSVRSPTRSRCSAGACSHSRSISG